MARNSTLITTPDLRTFMQELETRLSGLSHEDLKSLLVQRARGLAPKERNDFLSIFSAAVGVKCPPLELSDRDEELIADIDAFVQALEDGEYYEGWGWDDSIHDERAYGDMSWIGEMDELFARASEMYLASHRDIAAEAYGKLLHSFGLDEETGHFCGEGPPETLIETDVSEAKARYLRCIYELSSRQDRTARMLEEIESLNYVGEQISLQNIINADTKPLADKEEFIPEWIVALKGLDSNETARHWRRWLRPLLREAVVLQNGVDGLAELARESGDVHPEAYHEWVVSLWQSGDSHSAISAAREGVERIASGGHKAHLADALATMADRTQDSALAITSRKQAWRASPTLRRLLSYSSEDSPDRNALDMRLSEELVGASSGSYTIGGVSNGSKQIPRLHLLLHLFAHDYDSVVKYSGKMAPLGWSSSEHPGIVAFPFLTVAASGIADQPATGSSLAHLLDDMATTLGSRHSHKPLIPDETETPIEPILCRFLMDTLACHPVASEDRAKYLCMAVKIAKKRIDSIVSNTHRGAYERAARLAVAIGEAMSLRGSTSDGIDFAISFRAAYPRHIAFRTELEKLIELSPYLPPIPSRKKK
ncbi:MAG: hypothetical protein ACYC64_19910 [Armatimonadota bacterium]